ncbi:hypothetical protein QIS99_08135 [Streptomyces sp. B-S-A8]|uniref:YHS domain-containing protein n=1 Tax=Streptomyces solicavernae TaxID=3043614 RepID=A0ABT6RRB0_9ACTN|nr:hypothetical protein [Streptomyces sp. B-S-A8]MDI3386186.1 hypothetical protein [Streptomyces sp. B-S-A8]
MRPVRMCVRCQAVTDNPTVVHEVHQNTGPGFNVYACEACAPFFLPVPDVFAHRRPETPPEPGS